MGITVIPKTYKFNCDGCPVVVTQDHPQQPKNWSRLEVHRDAYDLQGSAVADASIERLLCEACSDHIVKIINEAFGVKG